MSNLCVILHGSVHHHQVRQEGPQVRNGPLHHSLLTQDRGQSAEVGNMEAETLECRGYHLFMAEAQKCMR